MSLLLLLLTKAPQTKVNIKVHTYPNVNEDEPRGSCEILIENNLNLFVLARGRLEMFLFDIDFNSLKMQRRLIEIFFFGKLS